MKKIIYFCENNNIEDYEELLIMSQCKNNIIANSTFSWWCAYINDNPNKIICCPYKWININFEYNNLIPYSWNIINY